MEMIYLSANGHNLGEHKGAINDFDRVDVLAIEKRGHEQKEALSCRKDKAAKFDDTPETKRHQEQAPGDRDVARSIGTRSSADSLDPTHHATSSTCNEETYSGLSGRLKATGAGDPPQGPEGAGSPTKQMPPCNEGDTPNSDIVSLVNNPQHSARTTSKRIAQASLWQEVNWPEVEARVFRIQRGIYEAFSQGDVTKGHRLQTRLLNSHHARLLAVKKAAEDSKGSYTPGVDGIANLSDGGKWALASKIRFDRKPSALRRVYIEKAGKKELRPLGIPTIQDRAIQHLIKLAIEPAAETILSPEQFGFRPGRGCWDAAIHISLRLRKPSYVLDADIRQFFDRIKHGTLLEALPCATDLKQAVSRLLRVGILDGTVMTTPEAGTPQGGPLSTTSDDEERA
jgi:hypothetical protein